MIGPDNGLILGSKPSLRDRFNTARYGHYFRSSTFHNTLTGNREWLYAVQDPQSRRCILMKVRENEAGQDRIKIKDGMAFFDALDHMSRFEHPDANPNFLPVSTDEKKTLGVAHYQNFALKEGLVRDVQTGEFHPTLYGHVVTSGSFDPHELARAQKIASGPQQEPESFIIPGHEAILKAGESSVEMIMRMHKGIAKLSAVLNRHSTLLKLTQLYDQPRESEADLQGRSEEVKMYSWNYKIGCNDDLAKQELEEAIKSYNSGGLGKKLTRTYSALISDGTESFPAFLHSRYLEKLRATPPEHPDDMPEFLRILKLHDLIFEHSRCRNAYKFTLQYHSDEKVREARVENHQSSVKRLQKICRQLSFDDVQTGTVKAYIYSNETLPYHREIEKFIKSVAEAKLACEKNIENEQRNLSVLVQNTAAQPSRKIMP